MDSFLGSSRWYFRCIASNIALLIEFSKNVFSGKMLAWIKQL